MLRRPEAGGEHVERILGAIRRFSGPDDERLPQTRFVLVEPHELEQRLVYEGDGYRAGEAHLRLRRAAGVEARLAADLLEVLFAIDGRRPLGEIVDEVATARGESAGTVRARALPAFLELYERGFLTC